MPEIERFRLEHSDLISYHCYSNYEYNVKIMKQLKKLGRPVINTEWLARSIGNTVEEMFPLFYLEDVGCYNRGFVAGKYQTYEVWYACGRTMIRIRNTIPVILINGFMIFIVQVCVRTIQMRSS